MGKINGSERPGSAGNSFQLENAQCVTHYLCPLHIFKRIPIVNMMQKQMQKYSVKLLVDIV